MNSGIEPATFRLAAQCLNQLRYRVHLNILGTFRNSEHNAINPNIVIVLIVAP